MKEAVPPHFSVPLWFNLLNGLLRLERMHAAVGGAFDRVGEDDLLGRVEHLDDGPFRSVAHFASIVDHDPADLLGRFQIDHPPGIVLRVGVGDGTRVDSLILASPRFSSLPSPRGGERGAEK